MKARFGFLLLLLVIPFVASGNDLVLVSKGVPQGRIVMLNQSHADSTAASLLQLFVERITNAKVPIVQSTRFGKGDVVIGQIDPKAGDDGFTLSTRGDSFCVLTGGGLGATYGIVTLLEQYFGVFYYAKDCYDCPKRADFIIPEMQHSETPAFHYRQTFSYGNEDPIYKLWYRLEEPQDIFADSYWVHTFNRIMPADVYGPSHPEYYALINGVRRPGAHSQWCLSNPDVFDIAVQKVDSIFKANPGKNMISVSQNDGNNTYCTCDKCRAIDEEEGSPAGSLIRFLNKLAQRFPDKQFSTLSYLYSMHPPKKTKPLNNVNIMLCDIDCEREVPLTDNASGREFVGCLEGWSKISNNIFVWDYGINFDNTVSVFPNFHVLQPNIQLFHKNHVTMHFSQVNGSRGTDYAELRAYMVAKLMWNPYQDADSLMRTFMDGYYGKGGRFLYQYQKILEGALLASGHRLWIYDSPVSHKGGMLRPQLLKTYDALYDQAEQAVKDDERSLSHVQLSRLSLTYSELEIARTEKITDVQALKEKVEKFGKDCERFDVVSLNERNNKPADYCNLYLQRYIPRATANKAHGAKVNWILPPSARYEALGETALTDDLFGGTTFVESWVGWEGKDGAFVLDMGTDKTFRTISTDFLHQLSGWILLPVSVTYSVSKDGKTFTAFGKSEFAEDRSPAVKFVAGTAQSAQPVTARYIKVEIKGLGLCPAWHYGVGHPAWFFTDEVTVE